MTKEDRVHKVEHVVGLEGDIGDNVIAVYLGPDGVARACPDCVARTPGHKHQSACQCVIGPDGVGRTLTGPAGRSVVCPNHPGPGTRDRRREASS